jgi:hypothetical protein
MERDALRNAEQDGGRTQGGEMEELIAAEQRQQRGARRAAGQR